MITCNTFLPIFSVVVFTLTSLGPARAADDVEAIEKTLGKYFEAISLRDAEAVRAVVGQPFIGMDVVTVAGKKSARLEVTNAEENARMLPPAGNDDMVGLRVSSLKVEFSESNPTAAMASFVVTRPLKENEIEGYKRMLREDFQAVAKQNAVDPEALEANLARIRSLLTDKQMRFSMLAMLAKMNGQWKIVCMAFPE